MGQVEVHWRRWFLEWLVLLLWLGLLPIVASAIYYAVKIAPDFDSALKSRPFPTSDLLWAVRVGGTSHYKSAIGFKATWFGVNPGGRTSDQRADRLWNGELLGSYQATYIARFRGARLPRVVCVYRDVTKDGTNSYEVQDRGSGPIGGYMLFIALGSAGILLFFKTAKVAAKRNTVTAA